jgi:4-alpha-methyl-delta7-sterol-4alpha-methyl oxidase
VWFEYYQDPRFAPTVFGTTAISMGAFACFAAPMTYVAWRDPEGLRRFRIQSRKPREQKLVRASIVRWLANNAILTALVVAAWPLLAHTRLRLDDAPSLALGAAQVIGLIYLDDLLYYGVHRAMHAPFLYRHVHSVHHKILTPWAVTGHYMHPVEFVVTGALALLPASLFGVHVHVLWAWVVWRQWEATEGHCGYDFPWSPSHLFPGSDGARHHDAHHARVKGNYSGFFAYLDGVFGTFARGYSRGGKLS